jgi:dTDP-4-amino-4,6-dideoxygalactose transaminase
MDVRAKILGPSTPATPPVIRFMDLSVPEEERRALLATLDRVLENGRLVLGPEVVEFENRVAQSCGRGFGIGVNSGTDALILGLKAIGIVPGDEVITTPLSWLATASSILLNGGTAIFCDIGPDLNMDAATIEPLINEKTKAILAVHFTGKACQMDQISAIAKRHNLLLIEDVAQAFGALYKGRPVGGFGDIACFSMNAMKVLAALGDAGAIVTDQEQLAERLRALRHSGVIEREWCHELSHNCRLDTVQAAFLLDRLSRFDTVIERRRANAARYTEALEDLVQVPSEEPGSRHVYYTYQIQLDGRDALRDHLAAHGIETRIQHPIVMNDQPAFQGRVKGESPKARAAVKRNLCLPVTEKLSARDQDRVIDTVRSFFRA